jgi:hypothetical protein
MEEGRQIGVGNGKGQVEKPDLQGGRGTDGPTMSD